MLYEDDHFHPSNSETPNGGVIENIKKFDRNFIVTSRVVIKLDRFKRKIKVIEKIETYGSGEIGTHIRNAITGEKTSHLVGSKDEDLYFSVADARGVDGRKTALMCFYDSPEQYERHAEVKVSEYVKEKWHLKNLLRREAQ